VRFGSFLNMRISVRLGIGFTLIILLAVVLGGVAIESVSSVAVLTANLYEHPFAVTEKLLTARGDMRAAQRAVRDAALSDNAAERDRFGAEVDAQLNSASQALQTARAAFLGDKAGFDKAESAYTAYGQAAHAALELLRQDKTRDAVAYLHGPAAHAVQAVSDAMNPLIAFASNKAATFMEGAKAKRDQAVLTNVLLLTAAVLLGASISLVATLSITRPLAALRTCMSAIADSRNDVTVPGLARRDEVGEMARAVDVFRQNGVEMERLRGENDRQKAKAEAERKAGMMKLADNFETGIKGVVSSVASQASQMQSSARALTQTAETATEQATNVSAAVEQASANVQTVASSAEELSASVQEIARQVDQSSKIAGQAVVEADHTNTTVEGLNRAAQRIGEVVQLIETIAGQTNLLACPYGYSSRSKGLCETPVIYTRLIPIKATA